MNCMQHAAVKRPFTNLRPHVSHHAQCTRASTAYKPHSSPKQASTVATSRRDILSASSTAALLLSQLVNVSAASANPLENVARQLTRPADITPVDATVALLDARSTLRDMQPLVSSAADSKERFDGRKLWPAYAKWLRPVGPSAPVAAAIIAGSDVESTLSAEYGGTGSSSAEVDAVYVALGRVLTISGRTIRDEAQFDVQLAKDAEVAIDAVISKLPKDLVDKAQQFRVARAAGKQ